MMLYRQQTAENRSTSGLGKLLEDVLANEEVIGRAECKTIIRNKIFLQKLDFFLIFVLFRKAMEYVALLNDDSLSFHILAGCGDDFRQTG
jgi:hypothetical protein